MVTHNDIEKVLGVELLAFRVEAHTGLNQLVDFEVLEIQLNRRLFIPGALDSREENCYVPDELVDEPLVERVLVECILSPQLDYLDVPDARKTPIVQLSSLILWKRLRDLLAILSQPVALGVLLLQLELLLYLLVNLLVTLRVELPDQLFEILDLVHHSWCNLWSDSR